MNGRNNLLTGNYTCETYSRLVNESTSIYIFWDVENSPQFTLGRLPNNKPRQLKIATKDDEESFLTFVIPCKVTSPSPEVSVLLYKITAGFEHLLLNSHKPTLSTRILMQSHCTYTSSLESSYAL